MKTLSVCAIVFILIGCATLPIPPPTPQKIIIEVASATDQKVDVEPNHVSRSMDVHNPEGQLSQLSFISNNKAFIKIFSGLSVADVTRLWNDFCILENTTNIREINLFINSPGGDAFSGLALADEIEYARKKGFIITAYASGIVASAAVPVLAVCSKRIIAEGCILLLHEAAIFKWPGRETASDIKSQNELMGLLENRYTSYLVKYSNLSEAQWKEKQKNTTWFSATQALEWGLADEIQ